MLARLHTVGGFQDRPIKWCQSNFAQTTPVTMVTKIYRIFTENLFSGSANLTVQIKFVSHQPCCHGNENFEILTGNLPKLRCI